jgi:di/tricarboxylate transporter
MTVLRWAAFGFPVAITLVLIDWLYLLWRFPSGVSSVHVLRCGVDFKPWSLQNTFACIITGITITLWCLESTFPMVLGNIGITSLIPVVAFFGSKLLTVQDFHSIRWATLSLMGGGLALSEAMTQSRLMYLFEEAASDFIKGFPMWPLLLLTLLVVGMFASLMNSTAAAAILYPVIAVIGRLTNHVDMFVSLSAVMVSGAQLFHMSTFANALVGGVVRHRTGAPDRLTVEPFLRKRDYPMKGWPTLVVGVLIVGSVGYGICIELDL